MERFDVAVVGASPAGMRAAWAAARGGASVLLLEARSHVGVPEPPASVAFDFLWRAAFEPPASCVRRSLDGVTLVSPGGVALDVEAPSRILRRAVLDPWLVREAERVGAVVRTGVRGLEAPALGVLRANDLEVEAKVVVFCDGVASLARRFLAPVERPEAVTWGAALAVDAPDAPSATRLRIGIGAHLPGGRSQLNPLDEGWSHWTFYRGAFADAEARARAALARDAAALGWGPDVVAGARYQGAAADGVFTVPRRLVGDRVLVAGGAGGQGGLEVGLAVGELAGAVAARAVASGRVDRAALRPYERACLRAHRGAYRALARQTERLARLRDEDLDALFGAWSGAPLPLQDLVGLAHPSWGRRALAGAKALVRKPSAAPTLARVAARMFFA